MSKEIVWKQKGPANRRNYEVADYESLPKLVKDLIQVLTSDYMGLTLSNMTGLALHSSVPKAKSNQVEDEEDFGEESFEDDDEDDDEDENEDEEDDDSDDEDDDDDNEEEEDEAEVEDDDEESEKDSGTPSTSNGSKKRKLLETSSDDDDASEKDGEQGSSSRPCTSSSIAESENLYKKFKTSHGDQKKALPKEKDSKSSPQSEENKESNEAKTDQTQPSTSSAVDENNNFDLSDGPKCYFEVRKWKQGAYTLITDDDSEIKTKALDLMVFFKCKLWNLDCGGNISYIARDEDNEVSYF